MGTRAVFTFKSHSEIFHVYKHWDGYPEGAAEYLQNALAYAWELPRFEADDFAAAFIAANKKMGGGDIRMIKNPKHSADAAYFYEIHQDKDILQVKVMDDERTKLWQGPLSGLAQFAKEYAEA